MGKKFDFCGWATRANVKCADGRTILKDAFADQDGMTVPLVWNHQHDGVENVLGHAILQSRPEGMYAYCEFNDSDNARAAKEAVRHGDVGSLSIWANKLKESANGVAHGVIREVSLVLAGANPEARIESFVEHSGFDDDIEAMIYTTGNTGLSLEHADKDEEEEEKEEKKPVKKAETKEPEVVDDDDDDPGDDSNDEKDPDDVDDEEDKKEKKNMGKNSLSHADDDKGGKEKTIKEIVDTMTEEQKNAMYALIGAAVEGDADDEDDEEDEDMKHNLFDEETTDVLAHGIDVQELLESGEKYGTVKKAWLAHKEDMGDELMHADTVDRYGIMPKMDGTSVVPGSLGIEALFPEARELYNTPEFIKRDTGWVDPVINGVSRSPFSRFRTTFADITEDEARARGYIKGDYKKEEVISLLQREITPQTIYKKQRFDKDDLSDITGFDVLAWVKAEMRAMLDEEIARAILVGDGRPTSSREHIKEEHVKSIYHEDDFYSNKVRVDVPADADEDYIAKATIRAIIKARKDYKGSGNPTFFTTAEVLTGMLLLEDATGRIIYDTEEKLRTALRVSKIVEVEVMENQTRQTTIGTTSVTLPLIGIVVNLMDYRVGADKGGAVSMFEDFDIDYNQQKILIETRISGMLIKPHSAMVFELNKAAAQG